MEERAKRRGEMGDIRELQRKTDHLSSYQRGEVLSVERRSKIVLHISGEQRASNRLQQGSEQRKQRAESTERGVGRVTLENT
jgi:uncharacterized coiled-coil DUF342 family protein